MRGDLCLRGLLVESGCALHPLVLLRILIILLLFIEVDGLVLADERALKFFLLNTRVSLPGH